MEKLLTGKFHYRIWLAILFSFLACLVLLSFRYSSSTGGKHEIANAINSRRYFVSLNLSAAPLGDNVTFEATNTNNNVCMSENKFDDYHANPHSNNNNNNNNNNNVITVNQEQPISFANVTEVVNLQDELDSTCFGRYIYVHDLPSHFNEDLVKHCELFPEWMQMCRYIENSCLGPQVTNPKGVLLNTSWFFTNQFVLEVIFHQRLKQYKCLTNDSSKASAIYVPFYAGFDVGRYLWHFNTSMRDSTGIDLIRWLTSKPEWKRMWGRDHFLVVGRIAWDFNRPSDNDQDWGNIFMLLPESLNMTMLAIESSCRSNEVALPYPTHFHPSAETEVLEWQNRMRIQKRKYLFSYAGGPRPNSTNSLRGEIARQCLASNGFCRLLNCSSRNGNKCDDPVEVISVFQNSVFCLQPPGDSYTRKSTFDSILAGCIPVFFHPGSAYSQYEWHFPKNYTTYSIFINIDDKNGGKVKINETLLGVSKEKILAIREEVIRLIPKIIYTDFRSGLEPFEDAASITIKAVIERVDYIRRIMKEGKDPTTYLDGQKLYGSKGACKWETFFKNLP